MAMSRAPVCVSEVEACAREKLSKGVFEYMGPANDGITLSDNENAFKRYRLRPRCLRDISSRDLSTTIQGQKIQFPVNISPTAYAKLYHSEGELAYAKACQEYGVCYAQSFHCTSTIEEVTEVAPLGLKWMQFYIYDDRKLMADVLRTAEKHGYKAVLLTVDNPINGRRLAGLRHSHVKKAVSNLRAPYRFSSAPTNAHIDTSATWEIIDWLKETTDLPIIVKGILTGEDAREAVSRGVSGITVSNHGGRQLDSVPATLDVLPEVVRAVDGACEVYIDGGIRTGVDVLKALALGARAVFIARPAIWGLAHDGEAGVKQVLQMLKEEFSIAMALIGAPSIGDIKKDMIVHENYYKAGM